MKRRIKRLIRPLLPKPVRRFLGRRAVRRFREELRLTRWISAMRPSEDDILPRGHRYKANFRYSAKHRVYHARHIAPRR